MSKDQYWMTEMENLPEEWKSVITAVTCYNMMKSAQFAKKNNKDFKKRKNIQFRLNV